VLITKRPSTTFEKSCALVLLESAMQRLAAEQAAAGKGEAFVVLRPLLAPMPGTSAPSYEEAAQSLHLSAEALRVTLHRLRKRFAEVLRDTVADTLSNPTEDGIQAEIDALPSCFQRPLNQGWRGFLKKFQIGCNANERDCQTGDDAVHHDDDRTETETSNDIIP
jgi:hypothetical protein